MAGFYADVPAQKMAYDKDGSVGFDYAGNAYAAGSATLIAYNDETATNLTGMTGTGAMYFGIIFPELRNLAGVWWDISNQGFVASWLTQTSVDTTNGADGTWVTQTAVSPGGNFRAITALAVNGIKSVRVGIGSTTSTNGSRFMQSLNLYGSIASGQTPDRLALWHPTLDQVATGPHLDYGDVGRGGTFDKTFRIKNLSTSLTANSILLSVDAPTDATPSIASQTTIGDGSTFAATKTITSLAPGAISGVYTLRIASTSSNALSLYRQRLNAVAASWT